MATKNDSLIEWYIQKNAYLDAFDSREPAKQRLYFAYVVYQHERDKALWLQAIEASNKRRNENVGKVIETINNNIYLERLDFFAKNIDTLVAAESRRVGGQKRAEMLRIAKITKHAKIREVELRLKDTCNPRQLTKAIAKELGLETDYVRKARKELESPKKPAGS